MSYIDLIKDFWQQHGNKAMKPNDIALYLYLAEVCNGKSWQTPFSLSNKHLVLALEISEKTLIDSRNRLIDRGLITFAAGVRNVQPPEYSLTFVARNLKLFNCKKSSRMAEERKMNGRRTAEERQHYIKTIDYRLLERETARACVCAREGDSLEKIYDEYFSEERRRTIEGYCATFGTDEETVRRLGREIVAEWRNSEYEPGDRQDAFRYMTHLLRIKLKEARNNEKIQSAKQGRGFAGPCDGAIRGKVAPGYGLEEPD